MPKRLLYSKGLLVLAPVVLGFFCFFSPARAASAPTPVAIATDYSFFMGDLDPDKRVPVNRVNGYLRSTEVAKCYVRMQGLTSDWSEVTYVGRFYGPDGRLVDEPKSGRTFMRADARTSWIFSTDKIDAVPSSIGIWRFELYFGPDLMLNEYFSVGDYLFDVSVTGFHSSLVTKVFIDGQEAGSIRSGEKKPSALSLGSHTISVADIVGAASEMRYECRSETLNTRTEGSHTFEYSILASHLSIAVICLEFPDFPHRNSLDEIEKEAIDSVDRFYREVSYGMLSITGEVFGWYMMPVSSTSFDVYRSHSSSSERVRLAGTALNVARSNGLKTESYRCIFLVFSSPTWACGGDVLRSAVVSEREDWTTFAHELGHLLGLPDLYSYARPDAAFVGYWDIMSMTSYSTYAMCGWSRLGLCWIGQNQVLTIGRDSRNVSATISPLELGLGTLLVKIETTNEKQYYLVEVRQETKHGGRTMPGGVLITYVDETKGGGEGIAKVIDAHPGSSSDKLYELDDATFGLWESRNSVYLDSGGTFALVLLQKTQQNYVIAVTTARVGKEALDAYKAILVANSTIQEAGSRLGASDQAKARLQEAVQEYGNLEFEDSIRTADDARTLAEKESERAMSNMLVSIGAVVSVAAVVFVMVCSKRRKK